MSRPALLLLLISLLSTAALWFAPASFEWLTTAAKVSLALSLPSLLVALLVGKRVRFDPVLR